METIDEHQSNGSYGEFSPVDLILASNSWLKMSQTELKILKLYLNNNSFEEKIENGKMSCSYVGSCRNGRSLVDDFLYYGNDIDKYRIRWTWNIAKNDFSKCLKNCKADRCLLKLLANLINVVNEFNEKTSGNVKYIDIINYQLEGKSELNQYSELKDYDFLKNINIVDLKKAYILLDSALITLNENLEYTCADVFECNVEDMYINKLIDFFEKGNGIKGEAKNGLSDGDNENKRIINIASFLLKYAKENNIHIIYELNKYFALKSKMPMSMRGNIFIEKYIKEVKLLPYSSKSKNEILKLFNYINNFRINNSLIRVPINIIIYTTDINIVNQLSEIIGRYMWFFGYLTEERYYNRSMNDMVMDKNFVKRIYETMSKENQKIMIKSGIVVINNFSSIMFADKNTQNLILNTLTEQMENNGRGILNIIYGEKKELDSILNQKPKLNERIFNIKLDVDELEWNEIADMVIKRLEERENVSAEVKDKIKKYVKFTYAKSEIRNVDYSKQLYEKIILNENNKFDFNENKLPQLSEANVPDTYEIRDLDNILSELNSLIGLDGIKEQVNNLVALLKFNKKANIDISKLNLHMMFTGNPGVGKTTVARLISDILFNLGYTRQDKLVEVSAKDLIAEYIGQTSGKTFNAMKSAFGGVLFIDEAYSIKDSNNFSQECIATIVKTMEDFRNDLVVIFAGYKDEMEKFMELNPGLRSRIVNVIEFNDYTVDELLDIFKKHCIDNNFIVTEGAYEKVRNIILESSKAKNFGNARFVINLFQQILVAHARNTINATDEETLMTIREVDVDEDEFVVSDKKVNKIGFI